MSKITNAGNGFIKIGDSLINLRQYKEIKKVDFGYDEDPVNHTSYGIRAIPLTPSAEDIENNVDGGEFISTYGDDENQLFEEDYNAILEALKDS